MKALLKELVPPVAVKLCKKLFQQKTASISDQAMVDIGGKQYLMRSGDRYIEHIAGDFEPDTVRLLKALASDSAVILDVGANIGCTALLFGGLSKAVYAFEPSPTTFAFLERNVVASGLANVFPQNIGLGKESGEYPLTYSPKDKSGGFVSNKTQAGQGHVTETIVIRRIDEAVEHLGLSEISFIKIDTEGFEAQVLQGAERTLAAYQPVIMLELNHWCLNAFQRTSVPEFLDLLRSIFPILFAVEGLGYLDLHDPNDSYTAMYRHILEMKFCNVVAAFDEPRLAKFRGVYHRDRDLVA